MQWERQPAKSPRLSVSTLADRIRLSLSLNLGYCTLMSCIEFHEWETLWGVNKMIIHLTQTELCSLIFTFRSWHAVFKITREPIFFSISTFYFRFITSGKIISLWRWGLNSFMQTPCRYIHISLKFITQEQKYLSWNYFLSVDFLILVTGQVPCQINFEELRFWVKWKERFTSDRKIHFKPNAN